MTEETQNLLETATPTDEQAPTSEIDSTASDTEQTAETTEKPQETPKPKTDWAQRRIDQLTREKYEAKREREALAQELAQYRQPADNQAAPVQQDVQRMVQEQARALIAAEKFNDACNRVYQEGVKESPEFAENLRTLQSVGDVSREFLEAVTDLDAGHRVLNHLGANPELAERVLSLPPLKQAMELAKLDASLGKPKPPPVSNFPAPISPVGSKASPVAPDSFATTAEYIAWRKQNRK